jgi:hypothetical protein
MELEFDTEEEKYRKKKDKEKSGWTKIFEFI